MLHNSVDNQRTSANAESCVRYRGTKIRFQASLTSCRVSCLPQGLTIATRDAEWRELKDKLHLTELNNSLQQDLLRHMMQEDVQIESDDLMTHYDGEPGRSASLVIIRLLCAAWSAAFNCSVSGCVLNRWLRRGCFTPNGWGSVSVWLDMLYS